MEAGYKRLDIYKLSHSLAVRVHQMTLALPKFEWYEEGSQVRRSSKSISGQIVEGFALRKYKAEFLHYVDRAYGSCEETTEHLTFLLETGSLTDQSLYKDLVSEYVRLSKMLFRFIEAVEASHSTPGFLKEPTSDYELFLSPESNIMNPESDDPIPL